MLQEIMDALQAPKNWLWSNMPGLHDESGTPLSGAQVAHNAFGTDTDSVWGKALGFGLDVAGDPLNVIAPLAARGLGAAAKGLGLLGDAGETAYSAMKPLRGQFGMVKNVQGLEPSLAPQALDMAAGGRLGRAVIDPAASVIGESTGPLNRNLASLALQDAGGVGGAYYPKAAIGWADSPITARHEMIHGIIDRAAKSGQTQGLPLAMRLPAELQGSSSPFLQGASNIFNEAAAHGLQNRGLLPQLGGYTDFLFNPELAGRGAYAAQAATKSPLAAAMYETLPYATGAGLAGGSYIGGNAFFGGR